jgi:hypothetical protein
MEETDTIQPTVMLPQNQATGVVARRINWWSYRDGLRHHRLPSFPASTFPAQREWFLQPSSLHLDSALTTNQVRSKISAKVDTLR